MAARPEDSDSGSGTGCEIEQAAQTCQAIEGGDPLTLVGLIFESAAGLRRMLEPGLAGEIGVGGQAFEILVRLSRSDGGRMRMSDLAAQTGLTPSGLTRAVDRLVDAGLIDRGACPGDRRGAFAILSPLGATRAAEALEHHRRDVDRALHGLLAHGEEERLVELLRKVRDRVHPEAVLVSGPE
jgi:DNA-binding MarR family transcriptional regulator